VIRSTQELRRSWTLHGVRVSVAHEIVLAAAARSGLTFRIDSGRRTKAEQLALVAEKGVYNPVTNPHGAAPYSPRAPHIKALGPDGAALANHALDVNLFVGGGPRPLARFYIAHGCPVFFNVATEAWHFDPTDEAKLLATARKLDDPLAEYPADERRWIREYDHLRRGTFGAEEADRLLVLRRVMTARRKSIWHAAQESGWAKLNRRARYRSLLARTT
jgi:hypothetical protein